MTLLAAERGRPPFVEWPAFLRRFEWRQGEHVTLLGRTGSGKTTLGMELLPIRRFVVVVATKPRDPLMTSLRRRGFAVTRKWPPKLPADVEPHVVFWPPIERMADVSAQRRAIRHCLSDVYEAGGWSVYVDEIRYVADSLGLADELHVLWLQGRSLGVSLVGGSQRPAFIPLEAYSQATHLFLFRESDARNLKRLAEIAGLDGRLVVDAVSRLDFHRHESLYVNTVTGDMLRTVARRGGSR